MKKVALIVVALLVACVGSWVVSDRWGAARLAEYETGWRQRIARAREVDAARRMPVLRGAAAREENAAPLEKALLSRVAAIPATLAAAVIDRSPYAEPSAEEAAFLEKNRPLLDDLASAVQCTRCDWEHPYEKGLDLPLLDFMRCRIVAAVAIAAGHERARAGDPKGAADHYLDAARFGADIGHGVLIFAMIGAAIDDASLRALTRLVTDAPAGAPVPLGEIDRALATLEPSLPASGDAIQSEALFAGSIAAAVNVKGLLETLQLTSANSSSGPTAREALAVAIPGRAIIAHALPQLDDCNTRVAVAASIPARAERTAAMEVALAPALASRNPIVSMSVPNLTRAVETLVALRARVAVLRVAIEVEKRRNAEGKVPERLDDATLPEDPSNVPARLRYEPLEGGRGGYRVWSVGVNGKDDGGVKDGDKDDILAERKPGA